MHILQDKLIFDILPLKCVQENIHNKNTFVRKSSE
jgi:hypothetical protein